MQLSTCEVSCRQGATYLYCAICAVNFSVSMLADAEFRPNIKQVFKPCSQIYKLHFFMWEIYSLYEEIKARISETEFAVASTMWSQSKSPKKQLQAAPPLLSGGWGPHFAFPSLLKFKSTFRRLTITSHGFSALWPRSSGIWPHSGNGHGSAAASFICSVNGPLKTHLHRSH